MLESSRAGAFHTINNNSYRVLLDTFVTLNVRTSKYMSTERCVYQICTHIYTYTYYSTTRRYMSPPSARPRVYTGSAETTGLSQTPPAALGCRLCVVTLNNWRTPKATSQRKKNTAKLRTALELTPLRAIREQSKHSTYCGLNGPQQTTWYLVHKTNRVLSSCLTL